MPGAHAGTPRTAAAVVAAWTAKCHSAQTVVVAVVPESAAADGITCSKKPGEKALQLEPGTAGRLSHGAVVRSWRRGLSGPSWVLTGRQCHCSFWMAALQPGSEHPCQPVAYMHCLCCFMRADMLRRNHFW